MNKLQLFFLAGAVVLIALAVLVFSGAFGFGGRGSKTELTMWGTWESAVFRDIDLALQEQSGNAFKLTYVQKSPTTYEQDIVEALAAGLGPDLWLIPAEWPARMTVRSGGPARLDSPARQVLLVP